MSSVTKTGIHVSKTSTQIVSFRPGAVPDIKVPPGAKNILIKQYHPDFERITGQEPEYSLLLSTEDSSKNPFFQNGCVYLPEKDELYIMSDLLQSTNSSVLPVVLISKVSLRRGSNLEQFGFCAAEWIKLRPPQGMPMPAGACPYKDGILYCSQGTLEQDSGGLWYMPLGKPPIPILTSYFGKPFNSIQAVIVDPEGALWFTDASIGFEREIRPRPKLPNQVYRFDPNTGDLRAVADGPSRPMGIAMAPDNSTLYVTDTGAARLDGNLDSSRSATIYAFDVTRRFDSTFLINRRVFAFAKEGVPTTVACDSSGNVYATCGDGVEVWSPGGTALGLIAVPGGCTNMCSGPRRELFVCAKQRLWAINLKST
ncbi:calcium-dependent phosphotriesterase [Hypomontagnella submonticulosa]|nr:calcium-dependent phosphotriesterase [Hypomontagnella submonticulosa]